MPSFMRRYSILGVALLLVFTSMIPLLIVSADEGRNPNRLLQSGGEKLTSTNQGEKILAIDSDVQVGISAYSVTTDDGHFIIVNRDGITYQLNPGLNSGIGEQLGQFIKIVEAGNGILFVVKTASERDLRHLDLTDVWAHGVGFEFTSWIYELEHPSTGVQCTNEMEVIAVSQLTFDPYEGVETYDLIYQDFGTGSGPICVMNLQVTDNQPESNYGLSPFQSPIPLTGTFTSDGLAMIIMRADNQIRTQIIEPADGTLYDESNFDVENMKGVSLTEGHLFLAGVKSGKTTFISINDGAEVSESQTEVHGSFDMIAAIDATTVIALDEFANVIHMVKKIGNSWQLAGAGVPYPDTDSPTTIAKLHNGTVAVGFQNMGVIWYTYDADGDGIHANLDECPETGTGAQIDSNGCSSNQLDADGDGVNNDDDPFPNDSTQTADADDDGFGDNPDGGEPADQCPGTDQNESGDVDDYGCGYSQQDLDEDGIGNGIDLCPDSPSTDVGEFGCTSNQRDPDGDLIELSADLCPGTAPEMEVDADGCSDAQRDSDEDGLVDAEDDCPTGAQRWTRDSSTDHDDDGCRDSDEDSDDDNDGLMDMLDTCPKGASSGSDIDVDGCKDEGEDFDDDGDGIADTQDGCPTLSGTSNKDRHGCPDSDGDGYSDPDENWGVEQGADYDSLNAEVYADSGPLGVNLDLLALILTAVAAIGGVIIASRAKSSKKRRMTTMMTAMSQINDALELTDYFESTVELAAVEEKITSPMMDVLKKQYRRRMRALEDGVITPAEQAVLSSEMTDIKKALADGSISKEELANLLQDDTELDW